VVLGLREASQAVDQLPRLAVGFDPVAGAAGGGHLERFTVGRESRDALDLIHQLQ
jgi:hypothetical protein